MSGDIAQQSTTSNSDIFSNKEPTVSKEPIEKISTPPETKTTKPKTPLPVIQIDEPTPDTPFVVVSVAAHLEYLKVFEDPNDTKEKWLLSNPGPGTEVRSLLLLERHPSLPNWLHVSVPVRPNGSTGWVHIDDVLMVEHRSRIIVDLFNSRIEAWQDGELITEGQISTGSAKTPTPAGSFYITEITEFSRLEGDSDWLIGTSAYSEVLETTEKGEPAIAILSITESESLGDQNSSGCITVSLDVLSQLIQLPIGTPIQILG
tara:strand:- start:608 stop:1390 length:783 start_codon:yes stop_codon:yes gene_type:complete